jgi:hypothetical protein
MLFALLWVVSIGHRPVTVLEEYGGPLKPNFSYVSAHLPFAEPGVNCTQDVPFTETVAQRDYSYDTIHVTGSLLFYGADTTDNLRWVSVLYLNGAATVQVCWIDHNWVIYVGTGNSTDLIRLLLAIK